MGSAASGQQAWNALYAKYHDNNEEARQTCYGKLVNVRMEQGEDPDQYTFKLLEVRGRLHDMEEKISDLSMTTTS